MALSRRSGALDVLDRHIDITLFTRSDPTNVLLAVILPSAYADVLVSWDQVEWAPLQKLCSKVASEGLVIFYWRAHLYLWRLQGTSRNRWPTSLPFYRETIVQHVLENWLCWTSKFWKLKKPSAATERMQYLYNWDVPLGTSYKWGLYHKTHTTFTQKTQEVKTIAWREIYATHDRVNVWTSVQHILKASQQLHVADRGLIGGMWNMEDALRQPLPLYNDSFLPYPLPLISLIDPCLPHMVLMGNEIPMVSIVEVEPKPARDANPRGSTGQWDCDPLFSSYEWTIVRILRIFSEDLNSQS